jgi:ABC-type dipeptide/oligopeptide/nickel transport system permease component
MQRSLYLILLILLINLCFGANIKSVKPKVILQTDTSTVNIRRFDSITLKAYSKLPEFQYKETAEGPSLWTRFWRWFWHLFDFGTKKNARISAVWVYILKYLVIALGIAALVFLIFKLAGVDMLNIFRKKPAPIIPYSEFF